ncbi:hypothetical protein [Olivibacter oleidegradans]|uniref:DUF4199 domain-containing protein n=1 Tax=Olivibacter oleidegradans TaxID=760123 RepID=A0ABV6HPE7_9SPHI
MNKLNIKENLESLSIVGIIAGITCFILTYATAYYWLRDGFDPFETTCLALITAVYFLFSVFIFNSWLLSRYNRQMTEDGIKKFTSFYQVCLTAIFGFITFLIMDATIYYLVDDTIPKEFTNSLIELVDKTGGDTSELIEFAELTFGLQNGILTFILGIIGGISSLLPLNALKAR